MMKQTALLMLIVLVAGCKDKATQFNMDYNSKVVIPSSIPVNTPFDVSSPEQTTNSTETFAINNTNKERIEKIVLEELVLTITDPPEETFSFLNDIDIFINASSLPEERIAYRYDIPDGVDDEIHCEMTGTDLQAYIKKEEFSIRIASTTDEIITKDVEINVYTNFLVDAKLIQ